MGDIVSGASESENIEVLFDLLKGDREKDFKLHLLQGNTERDAMPVSGLYNKVNQIEKDITALPAMSNLFKTMPNSLFLENGKIKELRAIHGQFSSFAFELDDALYFPIRNHRGDTCLLLDHQGEPVSTYH
jgi:hypothetical protein